MHPALAWLSVFIPKLVFELANVEMVRLEAFEPQAGLVTFN